MADYKISSKDKAIEVSSEEYYDAIAKGYNSLHEEEQLQKLAIIKQYFKPKISEKLLDVGCGTGVSSDWPCQVVGVDPSQKLLDQNPHKCVQASAEDLPFKDREFDYVISLTAIQNFTDIPKGLDEIRRVGKIHFAITFLKRSEKKDYMLEEIKKRFRIQKQIEEQRDIILILTKN